MFTLSGAPYHFSYLEHLVPLPLLDIIICPFLDYNILSIFHNLGSPLSRVCFDVEHPLSF